MPLRSFPIGPAGEEVYPRLVAELAARFDDPAEDRNVVAREALALLYLGEVPDFEHEFNDAAVPLARKALLASFDPRNATLEAEYYREIDLGKWAPVKPLLWFWQMFDHSPVGRNVRLGTQMRAMLAARVFRKCGQGVRIFHGVEFSFGYNLTVGDGVTIHRNVLIDDRGEVVIGDDASISDYANIYSHAHAVEDIHDIALQKTVIGDRARITYHSVVLSGVVVEKDTILGSMGVASKPIPAGTIVGGIPAKPIGQKSVKG
jgi:acetyltransferase-like isoleucine patch superfamily enzyme